MTDSVPATAIVNSLVRAELDLEVFAPDVEYRWTGTELYCGVRARGLSHGNGNGNGN